jgi:hypothetical protein
MRTEYLRSAWQAYDDNAVRFSFDEHMLLLREGAAARNGSGWCSPLESLPQLPTSDAVRFPYAILEVKLQDREASPAWVHELKTSGVLVEVPKFSKFLHGMALLNPDKIREVPSWFVWRETAQVTLPASLDEMWDMTAERRAQQEMDWQVRQCHCHWLILQSERMWEVPAADTLPALERPHIAQSVGCWEWAHDVHALCRFARLC